MKYLLLLLSLPAAAAIQVGSCINRSVADETDLSYLYKVTVVNPTTYVGQHEIFGVTKTLPKTLGFVEVTCPTEEQKAAYLEKIKKLKPHPKPEADQS